jgi:methionyl-tRNA formyltransferase
MRVLFFGDGDWAAKSLERVAARWNVAAVVLRHRPSSPSLEEAAKALSLPRLQPERANAPEFVAAVAALAPDLNVSVSYDQIVRRALRESARLGFLNFHAGMLPNYRGRSVVNWAILNGETEIGMTSHWMDDGVDTGDIVLQRSLPIGWTDTYGELLRRVVAAFPDLVVDALEAIASGTATRRPQAHLAGSYFRVRGPGDEWLDWSDTSRNLHNKIRAISEPGPGARTLRGETPVTIWRAWADPAAPASGSPGEPGVVVGGGSDGVAVATGESLLYLQDVEVSGRRGVPDWPAGTSLGGPKSERSVAGSPSGPHLQTTQGRFRD